MKQVWLLALAFSCLAGIATAERVVLQISTGEYAPLTDSTAPDNGVINRRITLMAEAAGYQADFNYMPWKRALELARAGQMDASSFWYYSAEREADFHQVGPIYADTLAFFHRRDMQVPDWSDLRDLEGLTIGVVAGYTLTPELWALGEAGVLTLEHAPNDETNFKKLAAGRIDLYPMSVTSGEDLLSRIFTDEAAADITYHATPLDVTHGYLLVSRQIDGADIIASALSAAIPSVEEDLGTSFRTGAR